VEPVRTGLIVPLPVASQHDEKGIEQRQPFIVPKTVMADALKAIW
jgi:hypothetical protein